MMDFDSSDDIFGDYLSRADSEDYFDLDDFGSRQIAFKDLPETKKQEIIQRCRLSGKETPEAYARRHDANIFNAHMHKTRIVAKKTEAKNNHETGVPPVTVSLNFQESLQKARAAKNWTQKELASKMHVTANIVADWENVNSKSARPSAGQINSLNRLLACKLPKLAKQPKIV